MLPERREGERVDILGELHGEVMVFQPMTVTQLGTGGAQIETAFPMQLDSLHEFRLTLGTRSVVVKGRIVYCRISDVEQERVMYRSGVEFIEPSERVRTAVTDFVKALKTERQARTE